MATAKRISANEMRARVEKIAGRKVSDSDVRKIIDETRAKIADDQERVTEGNRLAEAGAKRGDMTFEQRRRHSANLFEHRANTPGDPVAKLIESATSRTVPPAPAKTAEEVGAMPLWEREKWRRDQWKPGGTMYEMVVRPRL